MRKMASIRKIDEIRSIPNADAIECAVVGGWNVIVKRGEFKAGDLAVYIEIDAWVPHDLAPFLGRGSKPKEYNGILGYRLRTIKLREQISQGLLLPLTVLTDVPKDEWVDPGSYEGSDVSEELNIQKYEPPIPAELSGQVVGPFPTHILPKTDEERVQNMDINEILNAGIFTVTEKLDGTSATFIKQDGKLRVCGRNWEYVENDNTYWRIARQYDLINVLSDNTAIQGEIVGHGIQGNKYNLTNQQLFVFNMWNLENGQAIPIDPCSGDIQTVPVVAVGGLGRMVESSNVIEALLKFAEGKSVLNRSTEREGLVYRSYRKNLSFKVISNKFLLKGGE